ncbi:hypothetical protein [Sphingomonas sp. Leaf33]|uniref:hypothetical protein n=1 Tax=Sphingomonas sp. Leaf33 TaxID=1736215 RepID=UPI000AE46177|nr:hypothetical protein [Sphingomonas sp. Leaf33]
MANVNEQIRNARRESIGNAKGEANSREQLRTSSYGPVGGTINSSDVLSRSRTRDGLPFRIKSFLPPSADQFGPILRQFRDAGFSESATSGTRTSMR